MKTNTKEILLNAFDLSERKTITDVCRIVGVNLSTFYFHYYKDTDFRKKVMEKKQQSLAAKIKAI